MMRDSMASIKEIDTGWNRFKKSLARIGDKEVIVGIPGEVDFSKPTTAAIGMIHEFGSADGTIPERSFIRSTFDKNVNKYERELKKRLTSSIRKTKMADDAALFQVGEIARADVINSIVKREIKQDLKPETIARKGSSTALIDTGNLIGSIESKVRSK